MNERADRWVKWFARVFLVALVVWLIAAALLGIPHGTGHSIESMNPVQTVNDISFPVWVGSLAGIVGLLAVRAFQTLSVSNKRP